MVAREMKSLLTFSALEGEAKASVSATADAQSACSFIGSVPWLQLKKGGEAFHLACRVCPHHSGVITIKRIYSDVWRKEECSSRGVSEARLSERSKVGISSSAGLLRFFA